MGMAATRSVLRSVPVRNAAARVASEAKAARSPIRVPVRKPFHSRRNRIFSCPVETSACLESLQSFHTSALITSVLKLSLSQPGCGWLSEDG